MNDAPSATGAHSAASFRSALGMALPLQVAWSVLSAGWNFLGVYMIANGERPPGPTASALAGAFLLVMAVAFLITATRLPFVYVLLSIVAGLAGLGAVINAFTADPALWPSEAWRLGGAALNSVAVICCAVAITTYWERRRQGSWPPARRRAAPPQSHD